MVKKQVDCVIGAACCLLCQSISREVMSQKTRRFAVEVSPTESVSCPEGAAGLSLLEFPPVFQGLPQGQIISVFEFSAKGQTAS